MSTDSEKRRSRTLVWLPNAAGVLTVKPRGGNQWPWTVAVDGHKVREGVALTIDVAQVDVAQIARAS